MNFTLITPIQVWTINHSINKRIQITENFIQKQYKNTTHSLKFMFDIDILLFFFVLLSRQDNSM